MDAAASRTHAGYVGSISENDIQLLKLASPSFYEPIRLDRPGSGWGVAGVTVWTAGWGKTAGGGSVSTLARQVAIQLVERGARPL